MLLSIFFLSFSAALEKFSRGWRRYFLLGSILIQAGQGVFASRWDYAGGEVVMSKIREFARPGDRIMFLSRAHATPYYSFIHGSGATLDFPDGSPWPVRKTEISDSDSFLRDPVGWISGPGKQRIATADFVVFEARNEMTETNALLAQEYLKTWKFDPVGQAIYDLGDFSWVPHFHVEGLFYYQIFKNRQK